MREFEADREAYHIASKSISDTINEKSDSYLVK